MLDYTENEMYFEMTNEQANSINIRTLMVFYVITYEQVIKLISHQNGRDNINRYRPYRVINQIYLIV